MRNKRHIWPGQDGDQGATGTVPLAGARSVAGAASLWNVDAGLRWFVLGTTRMAEGTAVGYNRKKKGQRSYYTLFCTVAQAGQVPDACHRPGNVYDFNPLGVSFSAVSIPQIVPGGPRGACGLRLLLRVARSRARCPRQVILTNTTGAANKTWRLLAITAHNLNRELQMSPDETERDAADPTWRTADEPKGPLHAHVERQSHCAARAVASSTSHLTLLPSRVTVHSHPSVLQIKRSVPEGE